MTALTALKANLMMIGDVAEMDAQMATLTIRNLPEAVRERLRIRAAEKGRSMEAEVREILMQATLGDRPSVTAERLRKWVDELYGEAKPENVVDELIRERRQEALRE